MFHNNFFFYIVIKLCTSWTEVRDCSPLLSITRSIDCCYILAEARRGGEYQLQIFLLPIPQTGWWMLIAFISGEGWGAGSYLGEVLNFNTASTFTCIFISSCVDVTFKYSVNVLMLWHTKLKRIVPEGKMMFKFHFFKKISFELFLFVSIVWFWTFMSTFYHKDGKMLIYGTTGLR